MKEIFSITNHCQTLTVYEDHCVISCEKNSAAFMNGLEPGSVKEYYFKDLTSSLYKKPGVIMAGHIQFEYPGSHSEMLNFGYGNSFFVRKTEREICEKAYEYIKERIHYYKHNPLNSSSNLEELKNLKELLDLEIITQEEFDAKKKQLLGL